MRERFVVTGSYSISKNKHHMRLLRILILNFKLKFIIKKKQLYTHHHHHQNRRGADAALLFVHYVFFVKMNRIETNRSRIKIDHPV